MDRQRQRCQVAAIDHRVNAGSCAVPLIPQPISWPLIGGLDTDTGPLSVVPGSHLDLSDCTQERKDEWRARYGFASSAQDSLPNGIAPLIGKLGDAGIVALNQKLATYQPSLTSNRWSQAPGITSADDITRIPVMSTDNPIIGFAQAGNIYVVASLDSISPAIGIFDALGKTHVKVPLTAGLYIRARCAATSGKLVAYLASTAGNLVAYVIDAATGVVTGPTTIKTGTHASVPYMDAMWDGSSATITVVVRLASGNNTRFIEHNPSTGALATDVTLAGAQSSSALSLGQDYSASGTRFVMASATAPDSPQTVMLRVNSAGTILQSDTGSFNPAQSMTGVGYNSGSYYDMVWQDLSGLAYITWRDGSGLHTTLFLGNLDAVDPNIAGTIDGQAWSFDGVNYQFLMGIHSSSTADPQDSWVIVSLALGGGSGGIVEQSRITPLQGAPNLGASTSTRSAPYQRVRVSSHSSKWALPVLVSYALSSGVATRKYSIDIFSQQIMGSSDIGVALNHGTPVQYNQTSFVPGNSPGFIDEGVFVSLGLSAPPPAPLSATQTTGGGLTALATYSYVYTIETIDSDGNIWRSPPSVPVSYTLTGANNQIVFANRMPCIQHPVIRYTIKQYRTAANGSVYRLLNSVSGSVGATVITYGFNDVVSDASIGASEVLYTTGELATAITPRFSHMALFGDRLWGINADFRTELWPSKNLRPGRQPEFVAEGTVDIDDNYGDLTGIIGLDGNGVAFKQNAIYFITGDGLTDAGSGQAHNYQQVATGIGAIPGSPLVVAGDKVYFVSSRGIHSIDRGANVAYAGAGIDKWFNQPQIATPETVYDAVFMPKQNEVRFVTTNYVFVFDLKYQTWVRYSLAGFRRCLNINDAMVLFKMDGTVWREGDASQTTDNGTPYNGIIRSAWIRPTTFGQIRLYRGLVLGERTGGGGNVTPTMQIYEDNSDTPVQSFTPPTPVMDGTLVVQAEARPQRQNCSAFSLQVTLPPSDTTFRLAKWGAEIGVRGGRAQKQPAGNSWR